MEAVILVGIQASGKSTFYKQRFFDTHLRISRDLLRTRNREALLMGACIQARQPFVIDNTNPLDEERARYVVPARAAGFRVVCYFFRTETRAAIARNNQRQGKARVPIPGILGTCKKMEEPRPDEGFDEIYVVRLTEENEFVVDQLFPAGGEGAASDAADTSSRA
jgi:predicted kinase